jgi:hypothetical protein
VFLLNSRLTRFSATGLGLGGIALTYYRHPFSRSYGVILPSSLTVNHSSILGFSPHPPVSDYGTVASYPLPRGFSRQCASPALCGSRRTLWHRRSATWMDFPVQERLPPYIGTITLRRRACSCVPPWDRTATTWYGNIDPFPIGYASRPHLRDRLTLS